MTMCLLCRGAVRKEFHEIQNFIASPTDPAKLLLHRQPILQMKVLQPPS